MEFMDRVRCSLDHERDKKLVASEIVATHDDHVAAAHETLGISTCSECARVLPEVQASVKARIPAFCDQDAGSALAEVLWVLVRHLRPVRMVETGVARGVSSAFTLDALARNGDGHLWSIDLPPLGGEWQKQVGIAVAPEVKDRWTYIRGASRRMLPGLLNELGSIDIFTHDGLHTQENQSFEYRTAWPHVRDGGVLASDDVDFSDAFVTFARDSGQVPVLVRESAKRNVIGLIHR
jgi:predicted O-methyltransferase YrrM